MFWTPELAYTLEDAPWPATKDELIDYAERTGAPSQVLENLYELDDNDELYDGKIEGRRNGVLISTQAFIINCRPIQLWVIDLTEL